jgi:hypothetical protein
LPLRAWAFGFVDQVLSFIRTDNTRRWGAVKNLHPRALDKFIRASRFGRAFLEKAEFERTMTRVRGVVYDTPLGQALWCLQADTFRADQREGGPTMGHDFERFWLWGTYCACP